jgi:hypothetical protein
MGAFHELVTAHETSLIVDLSTGQVQNASGRAGSPNIERITAFVPDGERGIWLLLPRHLLAMPLMLGCQPFRQIVPLRAIGPNAAGEVSLYDPAIGLYLCAGPPDAASGLGGVALEARAIGRFERFTFRELPAYYVSAEVAMLGALCEEWLQGGVHPDALIGLLQRAEPGADWTPAIEALARLMPLPQVAAVAEWLMDSPDVLGRLATLYPDDFDATVVLPRLRESVHPVGASARPAMSGEAGPRAAPDALPRSTARRGFWRLLRPRRAEAADPSGIARPERGGTAGASSDNRAEAAASPEPETLGPELDFLIRHGREGEDISFPHICNVLLRQSVHPGRDVCIVATAHNKGLYLLEWIAYHRLIGVQSLYLYSSDNSDGSDALIAALHRAGELIAIRNVTAEQAEVQGKVYGHALAALPDILDFRWALIVDPDEFFTFDPHMFGSIRDYIAWQETQAGDAVALNWVVMCSGGQTRWRDAPVTRRFPTQIGGASPLIKTMCRPHRFIHATPHFPITHRQRPFIFRNSDRDLHTWQATGNTALSDRPVANSAWINHYFFKSAEEFIWMQARGRAIDLAGRPTTDALTPELVTQFMAQHTASATLEPAREGAVIAKCGPELDAEIVRLAALPGVAEAAEQIRQAYRTRIDAVVDMFAASPGVLGAGEAGERFLDLFRAGSVAPEPVS